jgi:2'-5' RNA ligase
MQLLALDVAVLPPPEVGQRAIELNAALSATSIQDVQLDEGHLPHVTLTQLFIRAEELHAVLERVNAMVRGLRPLVVDVIGGAHSGHSIWMEIARTPRLVELHEQLMEGLRGYERPGGTRAAFVDGDGRVGDVAWVTAYRLKSAFHAFTPHITLGHGDEVPAIEPFSFEATTVAACHLGRFCTCQRVLRSWELKTPE